MRTARFLLHEGWLPDRDPPGHRPHGQRPPSGQTDACENITLLQTSLASGKYSTYKWNQRVASVGLLTCQPVRQSHKDNYFKELSVHPCLVDTNAKGYKHERLCASQLNHDYWQTMTKPYIYLCTYTLRR